MCVKDLSFHNTFISSFDNIGPKSHIERDCPEKCCKFVVFDWRNKFRVTWVKLLRVSNGDPEKDRQLSVCSRIWFCKNLVIYIICFLWDETIKYKNYIKTRETQTLKWSSPNSYPQSMTNNNSAQLVGKREWIYNQSQTNHQQHSKSQQSWRQTNRKK